MSASARVAAAIGALATALLVGAAVASTAPAADPQAAEFTVVASRIGNLNTKPGLDGSLRPEDIGEQQPQLKLVVNGAACATSGRYEWKLNGQPLHTEDLPGPCRFWATAPGEGEVTVDLVARARGTDFAGSQTVNVSDQLIVSIGDSVASGEGNPDKGGLFEKAIWLNDRCHRSMLSGHAQAALTAERDDAGSSISFVPLGCSGATVPTGLLREYGGVQPDRVAEPAQLDLVNQIQKKREIDALLISVAANDVGFSDIVLFCAKVDDCPNARFDPAVPKREAPPPALPLRGVVADALTALKGRYMKLNKRLSDEIPADRIFIVEYFDPTRKGLDATGNDAFCEVHIPTYGDITPAESQWARGEVLSPLNEKVANAAHKYHWQLVEGVDESFRDHGICTDQGVRWIRRLDESVIRQAAPGLSKGALFSRVSGMLHPNELGHMATAELISEQLGSALSEPTGPEPPDDDSGGISPAVWIGAGAILLVSAVIGLVFWRRRTQAG